MRASSASAAAAPGSAQSEGKKGAKKIQLDKKNAPNFDCDMVEG
jgi:hypothetical protein